MATGSRTLKLSILAETKQLNEALKTSTKDVESFGDKVTDFGKKAALAFAAAGAAAGAFAYQSIKNAAADEGAQRKLTETLEKTTKATSDQIAAVGGWIDKTSIAIGVTDDELRPAFSRLARSTNDVQKAQDLLNLALDISSATGKPLEAVANALGKAYDGNAASLGKLGLGIDQSILKSKDFDKIFNQLSGTFGGFAANEAQTTEKSFVRIKIAIDEAQERIGAALLPLTEKLTYFILNTAVPALNAFVGGLTGDQGLSPAFTDVEKRAFEWGERIKSLMKTIIGLKDELVILAGVIATIFVVNKILAFVSAIQGLITVFVALRNTALGAAAAVALATYGTNIATGAAALLALGVTSGILKNLLTGDNSGNSNGSYDFGSSSSFTYGAGNPLSMGSTPSSSGSSSTTSGGVPKIGIPKIPEITLGAAERISSGEDARDRRNAALGAAAAISQGENARDRIVVNIGIAGDPEATARVITESLNNSYYRGTRGAGLLEGIA